MMRNLIKNVICIPHFIMMTCDKIIENMIVYSNDFHFQEINFVALKRAVLEDL